LLSSQCGKVFCVTYSGGTVVFCSLAQMVCDRCTRPSLTSRIFGHSTSLVLSCQAPPNVVLSRCTRPLSPQAQPSGYPRVKATVPLALRSSGCRLRKLRVHSKRNQQYWSWSNIGDADLATLASNGLPGTPTAVTISNVTTSSLTCSWLRLRLGGNSIGLCRSVQHNRAKYLEFRRINLSTTAYDIVFGTATSYDFKVIVLRHRVGSALSSGHSPNHAK